MYYNEFINRIIDDGIAACKESYASDKEKMEGAIDGFEACRKTETPPELQMLWQDAKEILRKERLFEDELRGIGATRERGYWYYRCYESEIEWVCNVVSAMLINQHGHGALASHLPTARGFLKAAQILNGI